MNKEELKEMGRELKEILEKYPNRQKEILFYIFGEDTIRELIGKPTYEEPQPKVNQLEKGICIEKGDYINGDKIVNITKDMFIKGQIDIFTDKVIISDFGDREVVGYRIRKGGSNE